MSDAHYKMFENRLRKMYKHIGKWARRQEIACFRVYDRDIPGFPFAVDVYGKDVHVAEFKRPHGKSDDEHAAWLDQCMAIIGGVLEREADQVFLKTRQRQRGKSQYERQKDAGERPWESRSSAGERVVTEAGLKFIVNLSDYLDTGLFLDHRITRSLVRDEARDKRVLNLFAYTGSFSVYAAAGGARSTTTVDLSNTYIDWARRNMELNGFGGGEHRFVKADTFKFLRDERLHLGERYDLAIVDPPTFSNSKNLRSTFDIERDHPRLINAVLDRLEPGGALYFSTNFRRFKPTGTIDASDAKDLTKATRPNDFRDEKVHYCFRFVK